MNRSALITLRVLFIPVAGVSVYALYQFLVGGAPALDGHAYPYGHLVVVELFATLAAAAVAALVVLPAQWLFGRFTRLVALATVFPILWELSPWRSTYHDFHWSKLDWAFALYEPMMVVLLILWFAHFASKSARGSNNPLERSREQLPQSRR